MKMRSNKKRWKTKAAANLMAETGAASVEDAVVRLVESVRESARAEGFRDGLAGPPYDPWPLAAVLGASKVGRRALGFDGRVVREGDGLVVEIDNGTISRQRGRFTFAHEVGHLALWKVGGKVVKTASRRNSRQSEIEELCNTIASEVLAPRSDVLKQVAGPTTENDLLNGLNTPPQTQAGPQTLLDSIARVSRVFDVSLQFAARRINEVCKARVAVALIAANEERYIWRVGIPLSEELLRAVLNAVRPRDQGGSGDYWASSPRADQLRSFAWRRLKRDLILVTLQR